MIHKCHANGCQKAVPPKMFMCKPHWFALPKSMRDDIWLHYRPGQERDKSPSSDYIRVAREAIKWLMQNEV
jgi:hypothetical protein